MRALKLFISPGQNVRGLLQRLRSLVAEAQTPLQLVCNVVVDDTDIRTPALELEGYFVPLKPDTSDAALRSLLHEVLGAETPVPERHTGLLPFKEPLERP